MLELRSRDEGEDLHRRVHRGRSRARASCGTPSTSCPRRSPGCAARWKGSPCRWERPSRASTERSLAALSGCGRCHAHVRPAAGAAGLHRAGAERRQPVAAPAVVLPAAAAVEPPAGDLWQPPVRPEPVPVVAEAGSDVRSWVVRELQLDAEAEPVAALTMRILDLRTPAPGSDADEEPEPAVSGTGARSRPADSRVASAALA